MRAVARDARLHDLAALLVTPRRYSRRRVTVGGILTNPVAFTAMFDRVTVAAADARRQLLQAFPPTIDGREV